MDEADIDLVSSGSPHRSGSKRGANEPLSPRPPNKRKPGPIPREVTVRRPSPALPPPVLPLANNNLPPPLLPAIVNGDIGKSFITFFQGHLCYKVVFKLKFLSLLKKYRISFITLIVIFLFVAEKYFEP